MSNIVDRILEADKQDLIHRRLDQWYFVTPAEFKELSQSGSLYMFRCELIITWDPERTGRQLDAYEIVSVIDTYPSYPRVIPR